MPATHVNLRVCPTQKSVATELHKYIIQSCAKALKSRSCFSIAFSGGSLPSMLETLPTSFRNAGIDPQFDKWHILLADERLVPSTHDDSNMKLIRDHFLTMEHVNIPEYQIYKIDESLLVLNPDDHGGSADCHDAEIALRYQIALDNVLALCDGSLDCICLGFGPDGHTCSLFPNHQLLNERSKLICAINNSPKPPPRRITMTFPVLDAARCLITVGTGSSKGPIVKGSFQSVKQCSNGEGESSSCADGVQTYSATTIVPAPFPCVMVYPAYKESVVVWILDSDAAEALISTCASS